MNSASEGWYVDPSTGTNLRYWSGSTWTDEVAPLPAEPKRADATELSEKTPSDTVAEERATDPVATVQNPSGPPVQEPADGGTDEGGLDPELEATLLTRREVRTRRGSDTALDDTPKHLTSTSPLASVEQWPESVEELEIPASEDQDTAAEVSDSIKVDAHSTRRHRVIRMSVLLGILTVATSVAVLTAGSI